MGFDSISPGAASMANEPAKAYRTQQVMSASPQKLVLMVFDHIVAGCKARDSKRASSGLATLIDALDFEAGDIATGLFRLYRYAMERVKQNQFDEALAILEPLRDTWAQATLGQGQ
ncbi:MAG TPA: flagellar protein FliS [Firmicutes bacterium]|nr:flagellar protein FliS [Bacillota bacterium]